VVVNYTGGETWVNSLRVLRVGGRLLTCGATAGFNPNEDIRFIWTFELKVLGSNGWMRGDVLQLLDMVKSGRITGVVDATLPLEQGAEAIRRLESREVFGKIVVTP
jgi:alcohol dehydrogenase